MANHVVRDYKAFWAGIIFLVSGLAAVIVGQDYPMGTAGRMGPAYFPVILGGILGLIGAISVTGSLFGENVCVERISVRNALLVLISTILFAFLLRKAGIIVAIIVTVLLGGYASSKFRIGPYLLLAIGLSAFAAFLFVWILALPMPVAGPWLDF